MTSSLPQSGIRTVPLANVLVVDDDFDSAESLMLLLGHAGYAARVALNAPSALTIVEDDFIPDYAVIDIGLPEVTGFELAAALRAKPGLDACRFISLSGYVLDGISERSEGAGFAVHLTKPLAIETLLAAFSSPVRDLRHG